VRTRGVTRIAAATYANALVTAGVGDGDVLIAAPTANPVTGESGLVGALKAFPQCQGGAQPDPSRVRLAYGQLAATIALAGPTGDVGRASNVVLRAAQAVITGKATDDASAGAALERAAAGESWPSIRRPDRGRSPTCRGSPAPTTAPTRRAPKSSRPRRPR
jgi:uncharacterized protein YpuA (DUF1002 family)